MKCFSDETRRKMSESAKARCTEEWRRARSEALETKLDTKLISTMYESGMTQTEIAAALGTTQKIIWRHMKNHGIKARVAKKRDQTGPRNLMWKGEYASYSAFHLRVYMAKGKASDYGCSVCGKTNKDGTSYDWANLTGRYDDIEDYAPMCRSCHRKYDKGRRRKNA